MPTLGVKRLKSLARAPETAEVGLVDPFMRFRASRILALLKPGDRAISRITLSRRTTRSIASGSCFTALAGMTTAPWKSA